MFERLVLYVWDKKCNDKEISVLQRMTTANDSSSMKS